jgi:hypothetical protein
MITLKKKLLICGPGLLVLWVAFVALGVPGKADAHPDGAMPIRVGFSPQSAPSGSPVTMTVTLSSNVSEDSNVGVAYDTVTGPSTVTVPSGTNTGSTTVYPSGSSGDTGTATANLNEGNASGSVGIQ